MSGSAHRPPSRENGSVGRSVGRAKKKKLNRWNVSSKNFSSFDGKYDSVPFLLSEPRFYPVPGVQIDFFKRNDFENMIR